MSDFNVRADAVDVDDIMRQIRARIREKRGADYTEAEVAKLASVKLEKFLDPKGVRSDLVEQFRKSMAAGVDAPAEAVDESVIYGTRPMVRRIRRLLNPILRLFFSPAALLTAAQASAVSRRRQDMLVYELVHNLVVEVTRLGIDVHNMKMRLESLSSRVDFDERRGRALEGVVQYRPPAPQPESRPEPRREQQQRPASRSDPRPEPRPAQRMEPRPDPRPDMPTGAKPEGVPDAGPADRAAVAVTDVAGVPGGPGGAGPDGDRRRRRRRRRRRPGQTMADAPSNGANSGNGAPTAHVAGSADGPRAPGAPTSAPVDDDGPDDGGPEE